MVFHPNRNKPAKQAGRLAAWGALGAGTALLAYSLLQSSSGHIPGWQPVNPSLQTALSAGTSREPVVSPTSTASAGAAASPVPTLAQPASPGPAAASPAPTLAEPASADPSLLDLNTATEAELDGLPGIGPAKAKTILAYRQAHHGFRSAEELLQVKGIGPKLLDKIRPLLSVAPSGNGP